MKLPVCYETSMDIYDPNYFNCNLMSPKAEINIKNYFTITKIVNSNSVPLKKILILLIDPAN